VTVLGPGGVGKTRLALRFAEATVSSLDLAPGGVVVCDLAEAATLRDLCAAVASALETTLGPGASDGDAQAHLGRLLGARGGERVSLARKRSLRLLLAALTSARLRSPSRALDSAALLALGWPGDRVLPAAGAHRVRVAIATLRRLGLREHLVSRDDGYLLDPAAAVELARDEN
jgi:hypothetical protein